MFVNFEFHKNSGHHRKKVHCTISDMKTLNLKIHRFNFSSINSVIYVFLLILVHLNCVQLQKTIVTIDCSLSELLSEGSCAIPMPIKIKDGDTCDFINVPSSDKIIHLKFATTVNLSKIPNEIFEKLPNLQFIDLTIGLEKLPTNRLFSGKTVKSIVLSDNYIQTIPKEAFAGATQLEEINLRYNRISHIDDNAFVDLNSLDTLVLTGNRLTTLKRNLFTGLTNLKNLELGDNDIESIEEDALNLPLLEEFLFRRNKLKNLSDRVFSNTPNLLNVDLRDNFLEKIGQAFATLHKMNQLQLSNNEKLTDLNLLNFAKLQSLISLELDSVGLRTIGQVQPVDSDSFRTSTLTTLNLKNNHFSEMDFLRRLTVFGKLEKLFVDKNKFIRWNDDDISQIKVLFPNIELIVTKNNIWDKKWVEDTLVPTFKLNHIFCNQIKYLGVYIYGFQKGSDQLMVDASECV